MFFCSLGKKCSEINIKMEGKVYADEKGNDGKRYRRKINQKSQQKCDQIVIGRIGSNDGIIYSDCSIC